MITGHTRFDRFLQRSNSGIVAKTIQSATDLLHFPIPVGHHLTNFVTAQQMPLQLVCFFHDEANARIIHGWAVSKNGKLLEKFYTGPTRRSKIVVDRCTEFILAKETNMKEITWEELLQEFDPSTHQKLHEFRNWPNGTHIVVFENHALDSSALGAKTAVVIGPACTYKTLDSAARSWLNDLPSQRQYPCRYVTIGGTNHANQD